MISRLERLVTGREAFTDTEILFIIDVLEDEDIVSQVDGLFLRYREVGESILKRVLSYDPSYLNASYLLVRLLESSGRYREAEEWLKSSVELYPEEALLVARYGDFLHNYGRDDEADVLFQRALALDALDPMLRVGYADFLEECGRWGKAKKLLKQAVKLLPSGDRLKDLIQLKLRDSESFEWGIYVHMPTDASLNRFTLHNSEELLSLLANENWREDLIDFVRPDESKFLSWARQTGRYSEAILKVEREKRRRAVEDPDEWAYLEELDILNSWKPGFELTLSEQFFSSKCSGCGLEGRKRLKCAEGLRNCLFENEYLQFERENIREIVRKLKDGVDPETIPQLQIPEHLSELVNKLYATGNPKEQTGSIEGKN